VSLLLLATEEGVAEEAANPILPVVPELFWSALTFGAFFLLIKYVLLPPVKRTMELRAEAIRSDLDAAEAAKASASSAAGDVDDQLADARAEAVAVIDAARSEAESERQSILAQATAEVSKMKELADADLASARSEALEQIRPKVVELASTAASKAMDRTIDVEAARPIVDSFLSNSN
jgi:F-type H+-transporting ATPase subunit b